MSEKTRTFVASQRFVGMQVIDSKGMVVGNVKDVSISFHEKAMAFLVTTRNRNEVDIPWDDVASVEDVVLLRNEIELPKLIDADQHQSESPTVVQAMLICPNCGGSAPGQAKFCPRCGHSVK